MPKPPGPKEIEFLVELAAKFASAGELDITVTAEGVTVVTIFDWEGKPVLVGEGESSGAALADMADGLWRAVEAWAESQP